MEIKLNESTLTENFLAKGFTTEQVTEILASLYEGLPLTASGPLIINAGPCKIKFLTGQNEEVTDLTTEPSRVCDFEVEIPGIDPNNILSVKLPELNYGKFDLLTLDVRILPFGNPFIKWPSTSINS